MATTQTSEQTVQPTNADTWRAAAVLAREHRAGVIAVAGNGSAVAIALWTLAKAFDERAESAVQPISGTDLQQTLRRLAWTLRALYPCNCTRNKGLDTHPRTCPARGHAEEWIIATELDELAKKVEPQS